MDEPPRPPDSEVVDPPGPAKADKHLRQLALAELDETRVVLTETGHDLEESRAQCRALLAELDTALSELSECQGELDDTVATLQSTRDELSQSRADASLAAQESTATTEALQDHIVRLKAQIQSPWRLVAKWLLRRSPYSSTVRARSH